MSACNRSYFEAPYIISGMAVPRALHAADPLTVKIENTSWRQQ